MKIQPLVSIITVVYNGEKTIERTIKSVISQTYPNIEYIIIDGSSTDSTMTIVNTFKDKIKHIVSEKDKGIYDAMNKGIALATGDVIGLLNADDYYEFDTIQSIVKYYEPGLVNYHGFLRIIDANDNIFIDTATDKLHKLKRGMVVNHPTLFVNKEVYEKFGTFSLKFKIAADWDFTLRCYLNGVSFKRIPRVITNFSIGGVSGTITKDLLSEMSSVRKSNAIINRIDHYYIYDSLKFFLFGKYLYKLHLLKKKLTYAG